MKLTTLEKVHLEKIETLSKSINDILEKNDEDLNDFACDSGEEDSERIVKLSRVLVDELLLKSVPELIDLVEDFRSHRKERNL